MAQLLTTDIWNVITRAARDASQPANLAVSYFGEGGPRLLPIPAGSRLVVDASINTVAAGATSPKALKTMLDRGTEVYSVQYLHAKTFAFDNIGFVGSTNASQNSASVLLEAAVCVNTAAELRDIRDFVKSLCLTRLDEKDLLELNRHYNRPTPRTMPREQRHFSTLLMQLTNEQGGGRESQVQPPKSVWQQFFDVELEGALPTLTLVDQSAIPALVTKRRIVSHDHNYTIEIAGAGLPRPAIIQMRRVGRHTYSYRVYRPSDQDYSTIETTLKSVPNPHWRPGRLWTMI